jgi:hypothetical protein
MALFHRNPEHIPINKNTVSPLRLKWHNWIRYGRYNRLVFFLLFFILLMVLNHFVRLSYYDYLMVSIINLSVGSVWGALLIVCGTYMVLIESKKWQVSEFRRKIGQSAFGFASLVGVCLVSLFFTSILLGLVQDIGNEPSYQFGTIQSMNTTSVHAATSYYMKVNDVKYEVSGAWYWELNKGQEIDFVTAPESTRAFPPDHIAVTAIGIFFMVIGALFWVGTGLLIVRGVEIVLDRLSQRGIS